MARVLAFSGSTRTGSYNGKLIRVAAQSVRGAGGEVTLIGLADYPMPIYNGDLEADTGVPPEATAFKQLLLDHDALLIASPEYNGSYSPLLKNALDWASRTEEADAGPLAAYRGKVAALMSASPGALGGIRGLVHLRMLLTTLGVVVIPGQQAVPQAGKAFDGEGALIDQQTGAQVDQLCAELVRISDALF